LKERAFLEWVFPPPIRTLRNPSFSFPPSTLRKGSEGPLFSARRPPSPSSSLFAPCVYPLPFFFPRGGESAGPTAFLFFRKLVLHSPFRAERAFTLYFNPLVLPPYLTANRHFFFPGRAALKLAPFLPSLRFLTRDLTALFQPLFFFSPSSRDDLDGIIPSFFSPFDSFSRHFPFPTTRIVERRLCFGAPFFFSCF